MFLIFSFSSFAKLTHLYKVRRLPKVDEVLKIKQKSIPYEIEVCCHYPEKKDLQPLTKFLPQKLMITAGAFPTVDELMRVENLNVPYQVILSEVFPSNEQIKLINNSNIKKLIINSKDFPTTGEVEYFNKINIPLQVNFNVGEFPLPEHMVVIKNIKKEITIGFSYRMTPGPGQVEFFQQLKNKLIFHVGPKFPYGEDANGLNMMPLATADFKINEPMMKQDVQTLNLFEKSYNLSLSNQTVADSEFVNHINSLEKANIIIEKNMEKFPVDQIDNSINLKIIQSMY